MVDSTHTVADAATSFSYIHHKFLAKMASKTAMPAASPARDEASKSGYKLSRVPVASAGQYLGRAMPSRDELDARAYGSLLRRAGAA